MSSYYDNTMRSLIAFFQGEPEWTVELNIETKCWEAVSGQIIINLDALARHVISHIR